MFEDRKNRQKRTPKRRHVRSSSYQNSFHYRERVDRRLIRANRSQHLHRRYKEQHKNNYNFDFKAFGVASAILAVSTAFLSLAGRKDDDPLLANDNTQQLDNQLSPQHYPFDIFGTLENPNYGITREEPSIS